MNKEEFLEILKNGFTDEQSTTYSIIRYVNSLKSEFMRVTDDNEPPHFTMEMVDIVRRFKIINGMIDKVGDEIDKGTKESIKLMNSMAELIDNDMIKEVGIKLEDEALTKLSVEMDIDRNKIMLDLMSACVRFNNKLSHHTFDKELACEVSSLIERYKEAEATSFIKLESSDMVIKMAESINKFMKDGNV